jgi:hypothetical protein
VINIKDMPHTTVEQVVRFRAEAMAQIDILQKQVAICRRALVNAAVPLYGLDMTLHSDLARTEVQNGINEINLALTETKEILP